MSKYLAIVLLLLTAACSSAQGQRFSDIEQPRQSIVVYFPHGAEHGSNRDVFINDKKCTLHNEAFFVGVSNGLESIIKEDTFGNIGISSIRFRADIGKTYYVRMDWNSNKQITMIFGGLIGQEIAESVSDSKGAFVFTIVDEQQALRELKNLHQDCL